MKLSDHRFLEEYFLLLIVLVDQLVHFISMKVRSKFLKENDVEGVDMTVQCCSSNNISYKVVHFVNF